MRWAGDLFDFGFGGGGGWVTGRPLKQRTGRQVALGAYTCNTAGGRQTMGSGG